MGTKVMYDRNLFGFLDLGLLDEILLEIHRLNRCISDGLHTVIDRDLYLLATVLTMTLIAVIGSLSRCKVQRNIRGSPRNTGA